MGKRRLLIAALASVIACSPLAGDIVMPTMAAQYSVSKAADGNWYYYENGKVVKTTTVAKNANGWWYIKNGKVDFSYNGLASNANGTWKITNGKVTFKDNGVIKVGSTWYNFVNSKLTPNTVAKNSNGWWYIDSSGKVDFNHTGVEKNENGWWVICAGKVDFNFNLLASNANGTWKITNGKVTFKDNGVIKVGNYWYYLKNSKVIKGPTVAKNANGWWYIDKTGKVDFSYTGIVKRADNNTWWYVKKGKVDFTYNGTVKHDGNTYIVTNGKAELYTPPEPDTEIYRKLMELKEQYPDGMEWDSKFVYTRNAHYENSTGTVIQNNSGCFSFAYRISDALYGTDAYEKYVYENLEEVQPGDILAYGSHCVVVVTTNTDGITVAEGNYGGYVKWGRQISWSKVKASKYYIRRY